MTDLKRESCACAEIFFAGWGGGFNGELCSTLVGDCHEALVAEWNIYCNCWYTNKMGKERMRIGSKRVSECV